MWPSLLLLCAHALVCLSLQLASFLGIDVVPPAVIRSGVTMGKRRFDLGVMILKPTSVVRLESTDPSVSRRIFCPWSSRLAQRGGHSISLGRCREGSECTAHWPGCRVQ